MSSSSTEEPNGTSQDYLKATSGTEHDVTTQDYIKATSGTEHDSTSQDYVKATGEDSSESTVEDWNRRYSGSRTVFYTLLASDSDDSNDVGAGTLVNELDAESW